MLTVIKQDGSEVAFDKNKIAETIREDNAAMILSGTPQFAIKEYVVQTIAMRLYDRCRKRPGAVTTKEISDMIGTELMKEGAYQLAKMHIILQCGNEQTINEELEQ